VNEEALAQSGLLRQKQSVIIFTDKHKCADLMYWFIFSATTCFGCLHRPSSVTHRFIGTAEMVETSPNKQRCTIVSSSDNCYSEIGITTLNVV